MALCRLWRGTCSCSTSLHKQSKMFLIFQDHRSCIRCLRRCLGGHKSFCTGATVKFVGLSHGYKLPGISLLLLALVPNTLS
jgi:hypothetical protein